MLVELNELDTRPRYRITPEQDAEGGRSASAAEALSVEEVAAARSLVRQAQDLLGFSRSPWESPFYRDPVRFVEQLTLALDRAIGRLEEIDGPGALPVAVYDLIEVEPA